VNTRTIHALGASVSELSLGTWGLSGEAYGPVTPAEAQAVIDRALELGITLFDTADCYGKGAMESMLGACIRKSGRKALVATRIGTDRTEEPAHKNFEPAYLRTAFEKCCERIGRNELDVVLLHNPSLVTVQRGDAVGVLREIKEQRRLGAWGVSAGDADVALAAIDAGAGVVALAYNIFHADDLHAIAGKAAMKAVGVLAHSVLAYGLLTAQWAPDRTFDESDHRRQRWSAQQLRRRVGQLHVVRDLVGGDVLTPRAAAVRFALSNRLVSSVILGPRTTAQLEQLMREAGSGPVYLPEDVVARLPSRLQAAGIRA
jgi:aryl-alcohol dehydrogenase-like predicted oxidoreductase